MKFVDRRFNLISHLLAFAVGVGCANSYQRSGKPSNDKGSSESSTQHKIIDDWDSVANDARPLGIVIEGTDGLDAGDTNTERIEKILSRDSDKWEASFHRVGIEAARVAQIPLGLWVGETEVQIACADSRRVIFEFAFDEQLKAAFGVAVFGEGAPPPPPDDPNVGYPPGIIINCKDDSHGDDELLCHLEAPTEGFVYTILEGHVGENGRFLFQIAVLEPYQPWCLLQTSYPFDNYNQPKMFDYHCLPDIDAEIEEACENSIHLPRYAEYPDYVPCPFELKKFDLCYPYHSSIPCVCEQDGCRADINRTILFDMMIDKDELQGQMTSSNFDFNRGQPVEIKLRKQTL